MKEVYSSNWLYNAGVIGLLRVMESVGANNISDLLSSDGTIKGSDLIAEIKSAIGDKKVTSLPKPLNELPAWHWNYVKMSFEWNYGCIRNIVTETLERAQRVSNRTPLRDQMKCKGFSYENCLVDFEKINQCITVLLMSLLKHLGVMQRYRLIELETK